MKVVHISTQDSGGAGNAAYRLHAGLRQIGIDSKMLVAIKKTDDPSVIQVKPSIYDNISQRVDWNFINEEWKEILNDYPNHSSDLELFTNFSSKFSFENISEIKNADIINFHWVSGFFDITKNIELLLGKRIIWTLHDMNAFTGGCHYSWGCEKYKSQCESCPLLGSMYPNDISHEIFSKKKSVYDKLSINIVTPSKWLGQEASQSTLFQGKDVKVIPYGLPLELFQPYDKIALRKALGWDVKKKYILFGAHNIANKRKGLVYFLDAVNKLEDFNKDEIVLLSFGKLASEVGFQTKFEFRGLGLINDTDTLAKAYSLADIFVIPSLEDNLPNTVLEAFACGAPVVGFNIGGIPDMIEHKVNGYLAREKDSKDLAEGIRWVLQNNIDEKLSINALSSVHKKYALSIQADNYMKVYKNLIDESVHVKDNLSEVYKMKNYHTIEDVKIKVKGIPNMSFAQAEILSNFIKENNIQNILELGFAHGVSTLYMATILEGVSGGNIFTIDTISAKRRRPNIEELFASYDFKNTSIQIFYEPKSYIWRLMRLIEVTKEPIFDFCYLDGAHDWYTDGFAFFLVDKLLKNGGWILFDDINWTYAKSQTMKDTEFVKNLPEDERETPQIKKVFELLVQQHPSYGNFIIKDNWGFAKKTK